MRVYSLLRPHHSTFPNHWLIYQTWRCFMGKTWKTQVAWNGENTDHFEETNSHWERCFSIVMIYFLCICTCTCTCICIRIRMCICICEHICTIYIHINISKVHCSSSQIHHRSRCTNTTCPFLSVRDIVWCNAGAHDAARGPWRLIRIPSCATASQPKVTWINQGYSVKRIRAWNMFFFSIGKQWKIQNHSRKFLFLRSEIPCMLGKLPRFLFRSLYNRRVMGTNLLWLNGEKEVCYTLPILCLVDHFCIWTFSRWTEVVCTLMTGEVMPINRRGVIVVFFLAFGQSVGF